MDSIKFYSERKPQVGEIVQVIFTIRDEDNASGYLTEYEGSIIMPFSQATKKKKIRSIAKLIPIEKPLPAVIEEFDEKKNTGVVSRAYIDDCEEDYSTKFIHNGKLINAAYQICQRDKVDFNNFWKNSLLPFLMKIKDRDEENDTNLNKFIKYIDEFESNIDNKNFCLEIKEKFNNLNKIQVYKKLVGIVSNEGIDNTKELFSLCLNDKDYNENISIKYHNTPNFIIETNDSQEYLNTFCQLLQQNSKQFNNLYVKLV